MGKIIEIQYNGELGYKVSISDVKEFFQIGMSDDEFLNIKNENTNKSNKDLIFDSYSERSKIALNLADSEGNDTKTSKSITPTMPCPVPVVLYVDTDYVSADILVSQSNVLADNFSLQNVGDENNEKAFIVNTNKFYNDVLRSYIAFDDNFATPLPEGGEREYVKPTVWLWSKSLNENGTFNPNSIFNLSPFIESVNVSQTETGGMFDITLLAIEGIFDLDSDGNPVGIWKHNKNSYVKFKENGVDNFMFRSIIDRLGSRKSENLQNITYGQRIQNTRTNNLNSRDRKFRNGNIDYNRTEALFKNIISENDIIFISFSNYSGLGVNPKDDFFINHSDLPNKDWQMIGLVDSNQLNVSYENSDVSLSVSGRDCIKLLIEDGSYFFAKSFANPDNSNSAFSNVDLKNRGDDNNATNITVQENNPEGINRLVTTGLIDILYNPEARNVNFVMNLLMSRLSNIEICYSALFDYYGEKRTNFTIATFETAEVDNDVENENEDLD